MASREILNKVLIEVFRVSRVPCDPDETIYQGDLLVWDGDNKRATKAVSTSGAEFLGMSDTTNPIETAGSTRFLSDSKSARLNVVQKGLVEVICDENVTIYPGDWVKLDDNAQKVVKSGATSSNGIGIVDYSYGAAGKAVTTGTLIKIWLKPRYFDVS